jgi:hypothetical protein
VVISWHARAIWDTFKNRVASDDDALTLSKLMRVNQHHYMTLLWAIHERGSDDFLRTLLHPEYADHAYEIEGFNGSDFSFERLVPVQRATTYSDSKRQRVERVAFEALSDYNTKRKRNVRLIHTQEIDRAFGKVVESLDRHDHTAARATLEECMKDVAGAITEKGVPRAYWNNQP